MKGLWRLEDIKPLTDTLETKSESIAVIIGENGGGKSFLLNEIAREVVKKRQRVVLACGTVYNKFSLRSKFADKTLATYRTKSPLKIIKQVILNSFADYGLSEGLWPSRKMDAKRFQIGTTLEATGFLPILGIKVELADSAEEKLPHFISSLPKRNSKTNTTLPYYPQGSIDEEPQAWVIDYFQRIIPSLVRDNRTLWIGLGERNIDIFNDWQPHAFIVYEKLLKDKGVLKKLDIMVSKNRRTLPVQMASSGEITKIANLAYITSVAEPGTHIIIDEPETSLHPTWQREFIENLISATGYSECKITIATHSPLIAAGAKLAEKYASFHSTRIFSCQEFRISQTKPESLSLDSLLDTHFNVIGPESHHLSTLLVRLLRSLEHGNLTTAEFEKNLKSLEEKTFDGTKQIRAFDAAREFAEEIKPRKPDGI